MRGRGGGQGQDGPRTAKAGCGASSRSVAPWSVLGFVYGPTQHSTFYPSSVGSTQEVLTRLPKLVNAKADCDPVCLTGTHRLTVPGLLASCAVGLGLGLPLG